MPASKGFICNMAVAHCGVTNRIKDIENERSNEAINCRLFYDHVIDLLLETCEWSFAKTEEALSLSEETHQHWKYVYHYPADCKLAIRVLNPYARTEGSGEKVKFKIATNKAKDGKVILCDMGDAILEYNMMVTNPALFSTAFVETASLGVAAHIVTPLRVDGRIAANITSQFQNWLSEAVNVQQREQREDNEPISEFERTRA